MSEQWSELETLHVAGNGHLAAGELGAVLVQTLEVIEVIDHHAVRLPESLGGEVSAPVQAFNSRTVAQVKPRYRVQRLAISAMVCWITAKQNAMPTPATNT